MAILFEKSDSQRKKKRKKHFDDGDNDQGGPMQGGDGGGGVGSATVGSLQEPHCWREDGDGRKRKLLLGEAVEVRSVEEGLLGSWHSGYVVGCENLVRDVKYDYILNDQKRDRYVERVSVSGAVEGTSVGEAEQGNYRGWIRPVPPTCHFGRWNLHYGLCVDVWHDKAWWEGVIFDHEDGLETRRVFFPDLGDELTMEVHKIRITQDWNEYTATWVPRHNWLFLELIEEYEQDWPLNVSVKQIWYDVREKKGFENVKEWTYPSNYLWRELVQEAIAENFRITLNKICFILKPQVSANCHAVETMERTSQFDHDIMMINNDTIATNLADDTIRPVDKLVENDGSAGGFQYTDPNHSSKQHVQKKHKADGVISFLENSELDMPYHDKDMSIQPQPLLVLPSKQNELKKFAFDCKSEGYSKPSLAKRKDKWRCVDNDILHSEESSDAIIKYTLISARKRKPPNSLTEKVRKHLSYLGWKIEFMNQGFLRFRYTSPEGKTYLSLRQACQDLYQPAVGIDSPNSQDGQRILHDELVFPLVELQVNDLSCPVIEKSTVPCENDRVDIDHEYCPQAVVKYYILGLDKKECHGTKGGIQCPDLKSKAKKHLSSMGWTFSYAYKRGKREMRYFSPKGKCYYSLRTACKCCMDEGGASEDASTMCKPVKVMDASGEAEGQASSSALIDMRIQKCSTGQSVLSTELSKMKSTNVSQFTSKGVSAVAKKRHDRLNGVRTHSLQPWTQPNGKDGYRFGLIGNRVLSHLKDKNVCFSKLKNRKGSKALKKLNVPHGTYVLRSRKRAHQVLIPGSSKNPRTVLSWLIDNNAVLPRAKVHYSSRKDHPPMAEGRITRDGIKCNCCQEVFSLSSFELHAGSSYHRSAANIFLEDGRSLIECQMQMIRDITGTGFTKESLTIKKSSMILSENDYICSICHNGGDLVLCDQCPSSFHKSCLGLRTLPDGDWFCPSCCCGICGKNKFDEDSEEDNVFFSCYQCKHQYHAGCLRKLGHIKLESCPSITWLCSKECKKIFLGLQKLLGKSIPVGVHNLTWTLLKPIGSDGVDIDLPDIEALTVAYSKLSIALDVMHECFEPVKEPLTRRDVIEDVIFCRGSELNRLNFQGFYTVLLERNDELISVATVRVHGGKVAELPLVATRFQYRRLGMCRILVNELEKKLTNLGVERLVLPAVPSVLNTWTTSFGFSKMTESGRLKFLDYNFLDFQGTVMCQKLLVKTPLAKSNQSTPWSKHIIECNKQGVLSKALNSEESEAENVVQGPSGNSSKGGDDSNSLDMTLETHPEHKLGLDENKIECLLKDDDHKGRYAGNGYSRCYKQRRISLASGS